MTFQLCQIISYLSSWPHFWVGVINSRAGKCPPPLPLSQPGGKGEAEEPLVSPCGHPWEAPPRSCEGQSRTLPPQSLPLWRVGNLRFWEGSGRCSNHPHPFASWAQSLPPWPSLTVSPSPAHFPLLPPRFSPVFSIPSLVIKLLPFFLQLCFLSTRLLCSPPLGLLSFSFFLPVFSLFPER